MERTRELLAPSDRERLLAAMAELCMERGYRETSVAALLERAGVPIESFEENFEGDLGECLLVAINAIMGETVSVLSSSYSADRSEWDSALYGVKAILELMAAKPSYANLGYIVGRQTGSERVQAVYESGVHVLVVMIDRLREYGEVRGQPASASRAALGGAEAVVRREVMAGRVEQLPRLLPDFVYSATVAFLGQEEALRLARRGEKLLEGTIWE